jgi:hypothetical protein
MAGYNLPETGYVQGSPGFFSYLSKIIDIINKFDKDAGPTSGQVLAWNSSTSLFVPTDRSPGVVYVDDYIPAGTNTATTDCSSYVIAARNAVLASRVNDGPITGTPTTPVLQFGPRRYRIVSPDALWAANTTLTTGYTIKGIHPDISIILFQPVGTSSTLTDMNLITMTGTGPKAYGLRVENMGVQSNNANASFAYLESTASAWVQNSAFRKVSVWGPWKRFIGLDGGTTANLNSEMLFDHISLNNSATFSDAFMHSGITTPSSNPQQDQFLNYWFTNCMMEYGTGDLLVFDKGGHIHVVGGSYINDTGTFFKMGDYSHFASTMMLSVRNVRFELRTTSSRVIDCAWRVGGHVTFENCDDEAQGFNYDIYNPTFVAGASGASWDTHIYRTPNNSGPIVRYQDCKLMGYHRIVTTSTVPTGLKIIYDGARFHNFRLGKASLLSAATTQFLRYDSAIPNYKFINCSETTDTGATVSPRTASYYFANSPASLATSSALGNGSLRLTPWEVTKPIIITRLGAEFTNATVGDANSVFRIGLYADDGFGVPTGSPILDAGSISTGTGNAGTVATGGTPGVYDITLGTALTLQPGLYWVGGAVQGVTTTQPTMRCCGSAAMNFALPRTAIPPAGDANYCWAMSGVTGALSAWSGVSQGGTAARIHYKTQ